MTKITLKPGDYVRTEGLTEEQYHAVAKAFIEAGAAKGEYPRIGDIGGNWLVGWGSYGIGSSRLCHSVLRHDMYSSWFKGGRQLTIDQILGTEPDADGWIEWHGGECPVEKGVLVDVRYRDGVEGVAMPALKAEPRHESGRLCVEWGRKGYRSDIIAYRLHQPEQEEAPMTIEQLLAKARKHERKAAKHEQKRQECLDKARARLPRGISLFSDLKASLEEALEVEMQDPANWKAGDVVECVEKAGATTVGEKYYLIATPALKPGYSLIDVDVVDDDGCHDEILHTCFKWISRP